MRLVIQRVSSAEVHIHQQLYSSIAFGLMVLVGIEEADNDDDIQWLAGKLTQMRIFNDEAGKMNLSVKDINGELMIISQFTLHASTAKGNRPSFIQAAKPDIAIPLYEKFISVCDLMMGKKSATGQFGADMKISLTNDGPVTIIIDSKNRS